MSKTQEKAPPILTGADVRAERYRYTPIVRQDHMAAKCPGLQAQHIPAIENGFVKVTQDQLRAMIEAIRAVVAERERAEK